MTGDHLETWMRGKHIWLAEHFSVAAETLCLNRDTIPNRDCFCLRAAMHPGLCSFRWSPDIRDQSWKDAK